MKTITLDIGDESADWIKSVAKDRAKKKKPLEKTGAAYLSVLKSMETQFKQEDELAAAGGEFDEGEHPRAEDGQFTFKGEGVAPGTGAEKTKEEKKIRLAQIRDEREKIYQKTLKQTREFEKYSSIGKAVVNINSDSDHKKALIAHEKIMQLRADDEKLDQERKTILGITEPKPLQKIVAESKAKYLTMRDERKLMTPPAKNVADPSYDPNSEQFRPYLMATTKEHQAELEKHWVDEINHKTTLGKDAAMWDAKVAAGEDTKSLNQVNGEYTPERKALHETILTKFDKPPLPGQMTAVFFGGASASGKGGLMGYVPDSEKMVLINNDEIKKELPEATRTNAGYLHTEARDITDELMVRTVTDGKSFIYDGTMRDVKKTEALMQKAKDEGYRVIQLSTNAPVEESLERSAGRFLRAGEEGRYVPVGRIISEHDKTNSAQFEIISSKNVDQAAIFDTDVPMGEPFKLIAYKGDIPTKKK